MSTTDIPPPGPERDAEIARAARRDDHAEIPVFTAQIGPEIPSRWVRVLAVPQRTSTDPSACDRLVEEMVRRGFELVHRADSHGHGARFMIADAASDDGLAYYDGRGATRMEAVSAAALLALRGGQ